MKNFCIFLLSILLLGSFAGAEIIRLQPVTPKENQKPADAQPQLKPYIDFIVEWTSHKYQGEELPQIQFEDHGLVQVFAYGDLEYAQAEAQGKKLNTVSAVYDASRKTIYVSNTIKDNQQELELALVHELVHYLQEINGYTASLNGHLECTESDAYDIQMLWQILIHKVDVKSNEVRLTHERSLLAAMECMGDMSKAFSQGNSQEW